MVKSILADNFYLPRQASTVAPGIDNLFNVILWICIFFTALVTVLMVLLVIKYRHKSGVQRDTAAGHSTALEIAWTVIPTIIVGFLYYYGFAEYMNLAVEPPNAYEITATGKMWNWSFTYPNGHVDDELHVPVNTPVRVVLESQDVIHSLYIPAFRVKKDVVPGRFNRLWFTATETTDQIGPFDIYCAGYCGTNHSAMRSRAFVHQPEQFRQWLADASNPFKFQNPIEVGRSFYVKRGCVQCHSIDGSKVTGPTWKDLFGSTQQFTDGASAKVDEDFIRHFVEYPQEKIPVGFLPVMPSFKGQFQPREVNAIITFMKSISANFKGDLSQYKTIDPNFGLPAPTGSPGAATPGNPK